MKINVLILFFSISISLFICRNIYGQSADTLISYNPVTKQILALPLSTIDSLRSFDHTEWNLGSEYGLDILNTEPPVNTYKSKGYPTSGSTDFIPVQELYSSKNYPARTTVKLFVRQNGKLKQRCSGILVARRYVLTDCHCLVDSVTKKELAFSDSIWAFPAFDNGAENPVFGKSLGIEYFTFKSNTKNMHRNSGYNKDIGLIKLKEELGVKTGWVGIAFAKDTNFYKEKVFHKFSYPGTVDLFDTTRIFNGDTLYYNYCTLDIINGLGYGIDGIRGQSGSSLLYTDNKEYYSLGTQVWSLYSEHFRITPEVFYAFKSVLNDDFSSWIIDHSRPENFHLSEAYPNPFNPSTTIGYQLPSECHVTLKIFNVLGKEIVTLINSTQGVGRYTVIFNAGNLPSGIYLYSINAGKFMQTKKLLLLK